MPVPAVLLQAMMLRQPETAHQFCMDSSRIWPARKQLTVVLMLLMLTSARGVQINRALRRQAS